MLVIIKKASAQQECTHEILPALNPCWSFKVASGSLTSSGDYRHPTYRVCGAQTKSLLVY